MVQDCVCPFCEESSAKGTGKIYFCLLNCVVLLLFEGNIFVSTENSGKVARAKGKKSGVN